MSLIEVSAGLLFHNGKLLITQRRPGDHLGGLWEFPGGKRHADETFEECLRRELSEELGITVEVVGLVVEIVHHYPEKSVHLKFFRCRLMAGEPRPLHCHDLAWVTAIQLRSYQFPDADAQLLSDLEVNPELWR